MKIVYRLIAAVLFIGFFFFALKNTQEVTLYFFMGYERTDPLVLIILVCFIIGIILGILAMIPVMLRYRKEASRQKRMSAVLQAELDTLRKGNAPGSSSLDTVIPEAHLH